MNEATEGDVRQSEYYYEGDREYDEDLGCAGCGWDSPHERRTSLPGN